MVGGTDGRAVVLRIAGALLACLDGKGLEAGNVSWIYKQTEPGHYTVGFYAPNGEFHTDSDHDSKEDAAARCHYLNGRVD